MNAQTANPARPLVWLFIVLGVIGVGIAAIYQLGNMGDMILSFSVTQVFWMGVFFLLVGVALMMLPGMVRNPARGIALLILVLGIGAMLVAGGYTAFNIGDNFLTFNLSHLLWIGIAYAVIGVILLSIARPDEPAAAPRVERSTEQVTPVRAQVAPPSPVTPPSTARVQRGPLKPALREDLEGMIEGIGPKIQDALYKGGVTTFAQLAKLSPGEIYRIVKIDGGVPILGEPDTWAAQAQYIVAGDLEGLKDYQKRLIGGRDKKP